MSNTTPELVRGVLPELLFAKEDLGVLDSGTNLSLKNSAVEVPTILKDSTTLVSGTDFTFVSPRKITLGTAAASENYTAHVHLAFTDAKLTEFIDGSDRIIANQFVNMDTPSAVHLSDWSRDLTAHKVLVLTARGDLDKVAWARSFRTMAMDAIAAYKENTSKGTFDDSEVTRDDENSVDAFALDQQAVKNYESDESYR